MFELLIVVLLIILAPLAFGVLIGVLGLLFGGGDSASDVPHEPMLPCLQSSGQGLVAWGLFAAAIVVVCVALKYFGLSAR